MKTIIALITGAACLFSPLSLAEPTAQARAMELYRKGLAATKVGETATAEACFREVLRLQPRNANARYQLHQLKLNAPSLAAKKRKLQLQRIKLAKIEFDELSLREALDTLNLLVLQATKEEFAPNFIVQDPGDTLGQRRLSLQLSNIPVSVALQYCLEQAGASARYEQHAIVVKPHPRSGLATERPKSPSGQPSRGNSLR